MKPTPGTHLRFFSNRVFGVWAEATVSAYNPKTGTVTLEAYHCGARWREKRPVTTEFYYPRGHAEAGEAFHFETP